MHALHTRGSNVVGALQTARRLHNSEHYIALLVTHSELQSLNCKLLHGTLNAVGRPVCAAAEAAAPLVQLAAAA